MATLDARARARLPDSAFAYVDPQGRRRLPINDEAHVRNALSRFDRVDFHDEAARDRARMRILRAAKRLGIMPLGFVGGQLRPERRLPRGQVTFLLVDLEGSTELLHRLGDGYGPLLNRIRRLVRTAVRRSGGREVDARGDELFVVFEVAVAAVAAASAIRQTVRDHAWPEGIASSGPGRHPHGSADPDRERLCRAVGPHRRPHRRRRPRRPDRRLRCGTRRGGRRTAGRVRPGQPRPMAAQGPARVRWSCSSSRTMAGWSRSRPCGRWHDRCADGPSSGRRHGRTLSGRRDRTAPPASSRAGSVARPSRPAAGPPIRAHRWPGPAHRSPS